MVIPRMTLVVDDGCAQASGRVDASPGDGDGRQVNQKHSESDGEWSQNLLIYYMELGYEERLDSLESGFVSI